MPQTSRNVGVVLGKVGQNFTSTITDVEGLLDSNVKSLARLLNDGAGLSDSIAQNLSSTSFVQKDGTNTGYLPWTSTASLTPMSGGNTTGNGQTIFRRDITGDLGIIHNNVTVSQCRINGSVKVGRSVTNADVVVSNTTVQDCEVFASGGLDGINEVSGVDSLIQRNNVHGFENAATLWTPTRCRFLDNYLWGDQPNETGGHVDGIQVYGIQGGATISGNTVLLTFADASVAPLNITNESPIVGTLLCENNLLKSMHDQYVIICYDRRNVDSGGASNGPVVAIFNGNRLWRHTQSAGTFYITNTVVGSSATGSGNIDWISGDPIVVA